MSHDAPTWDVVYVPGALREDEALLVTLRAQVTHEILRAHGILDRMHAQVLDAVKITGIGGERERARADLLLPPWRRTMEENEQQSPPPADVAAESIPPEQMPAHREYVIDDAMRARLENDYVYHPARADQLYRYGQLRAAAKSLAYQIVAYTPKSREQSLALTSLETAIMQANAAIAREPEAK